MSGLSPRRCVSHHSRVSDLDSLLADALQASPADRIELRDAIAAHGAQAILPMAEWLTDPKLGGFAVRVLTKIAEDKRARAAVLNVLEPAVERGLPSAVASDVGEALDRLAPRGAAGVTRRPRSPEWPGARAVTALELRFHEAMLDIYRSAGEATRRQRPDGTYERGYWPTYFLRAVRNHGGPDYARQLLHAEGTSSGFQRLADAGRLDLTAEALILRPEFEPLFTAEERSIAARRLRGRTYAAPTGGDRPSS